MENTAHFDTPTQSTIYIYIYRDYYCVFAMTQALYAMMIICHCPLQVSVIIRQLLKVEM